MRVFGVCFTLWRILPGCIEVHAFSSPGASLSERSSASKSEIMA
jgi:hypothetical protein